MDGQIDFKGDEILQPPFPPVGAFICATAKHLTEEDWTILSKYFYLMVPMSEKQRSAVAKAHQDGGNFSVRLQDAPVVYYPFEGNPFAPSEQSGGNFVNPEFEIESSPGSVFECVEGDGYDDLKTGKKLRWHDVSIQVGKKMMKPFYDGKPPTHVETITDERGDWKIFTWSCGYNILVKVK